MRRKVNTALTEGMQTFVEGAPAVAGAVQLCREKRQASRGERGTKRPPRVGRTRPGLAKSLFF